MLLGGEARQRALKAEGGRLATQALAIATVLVCTGAFAGWRYFSSQTGVETPGGYSHASRIYPPVAHACLFLSSVLVLLRLVAMLLLLLWPLLL
jgi:hypothetical protein